MIAIRTMASRSILASDFLSNDSVLLEEPIVGPGARVLDDEGFIDEPSAISARARWDTEGTQELRLAGLARGIVLDNLDPLERARVRLALPTVFGENPVWAASCISPAVARGSGELLKYLRLASLRLTARLDDAAGRLAVAASMVGPDDESPSADVSTMELIETLRMVIDSMKAGLPVDREVLLQNGLRLDDSLFGVRMPIPEVGREVWVAFEDGSAERPVWLGYSDCEEPDLRPRPQPTPEEDPEP